MIYGSNGLDLNFNETRKSLHIPVKGKGPVINRMFARDPLFSKLAASLRDIDYQQYLTRFKWNNLPEGLDSELFEKILYFRGSAMFFYIKEMDKFFFLPYGMAQDGKNNGIDFYGRYNYLRPFTFNGTTQTKKSELDEARNLYLSNELRKNIVDIPFPKDEKEARDIFDKGAVICWDSTPGIAYQTSIRQEKAQSYIDYLIKVLIQTKSALINASGFNLFSTATESGVELMQQQLDQISEDRERGLLSAAVSKELGEIENLQSNAPSTISDFWAAFVAVDNLRLKSMGIQNDGVIQKSQYQNMQSQVMDMNDALQVYVNSFMERIKFAAIVNSIWDLGIYPEPLLMPQLTGGNGMQDAESDEGESDSQAQGGTADEA